MVGAHVPGGDGAGRVCSPARTVPGPAGCLDPGGVALTTHPPLVVAGVTYDLAHLDPVAFETPSTRLGRPVRTWCWFTTHVFTRAPLSGEGPPTLLDEGRRPRVFCPDRYALSRHLPDAVRLLSDPGRYVWETAAERNWLHRAEVTIAAGVVVGAAGGATGGGAGTTYQLFFALTRAGTAAGPAGRLHDLEMVVESAYAHDPARAPKLRGRTKIAGLLAATVEGRRIHTQPTPGRRNR